MLKNVTFMVPIYFINFLYKPFWEKSILKKSEVINIVMLLANVKTLQEGHFHKM